MKNIKYAILISFLGLNSCKEPLANFTEPQPSEKKNISQFPKKFLGNYSNPELGYKLTIENEMIIRTFSNTDTVSLNELNSTDKENITILNQLSDTLYIAEFNIKDTLFSLKNGDVLRKLNQNYFLNTKNPNENWNVSKINFKRNYLSLSEIANESEIELLNEITNQTATDSIYPKTYNLNKKQFKEFVKKNGFTENEIYIKQ